MYVNVEICCLTELETGESVIWSQNTPECTKSHTKFQKFSGGHTPGPPPLGALPPDPRAERGGKGKGRGKGKGYGKGREGKKGGEGPRTSEIKC